jgi:hypothetical protein
VPFPAYRERVEDEVVVVAQVEGPDGMAALDEILAVPGLDVVFVGPFDLSQHLGVPSETDHPKVAAAGERQVEAAVELGAHGEVLGGGEVAVQGGVLGDEADLLASPGVPEAWPSTRTVPVVGASRPTARWSRVVLPAPLGPTRAAMRPCGTVRVQSCRAQLRR